MDAVHIAIIGDIHGYFDRQDVAYFNQSTYDLILCVGDLGGRRPHTEQQVARVLAQLEKPVLLIPGNHDTSTMVQLAAEVSQQAWLARVSSGGQEDRVAQLRRDLGNVIWGGFSAHSFVVNGRSFAVILARPFSMGGNRLSFHPYLARRFGVDSLPAAAARLQQCIDQTSAETLIFLAHNGPAGLGSRPADIWGCDFKPELGDFGDPDLRQAIAYAREQGRYVPAVVAGHMHHTLANGGQRRWLVQDDGITYVNAARVPRIFAQDRQQVRHHVQLLLQSDDVAVQEMLVKT